MTSSIIIYLYTEFHRSALCLYKIGQIYPLNFLPKKKIIGVENRNKRKVCSLIPDDQIAYKTNCAHNERLYRNRSHGRNIIIHSGFHLEKCIKTISRTIYSNSNQHVQMIFDNGIMFLWYFNLNTDLLVKNIIQRNKPSIFHDNI